MSAWLIVLERLSPTDEALDWLSSKLCTLDSSHIQPGIQQFASLAIWKQKLQRFLITGRSSRVAAWFYVQLSMIRSWHRVQRALASTEQDYVRARQSSGDNRRSAVSCNWMTVIQKPQIETCSVDSHAKFSPLRNTYSLTSMSCYIWSKIVHYDFWTWEQDYCSMFIASDLLLLLEILDVNCACPHNYAPLKSWILFVLCTLSSRKRGKFTHPTICLFGHVETNLRWFLSRGRSSRVAAWMCNCAWLFRSWHLRIQISYMHAKVQGTVDWSASNRRVL